MAAQTAAAVRIKAKDGNHDGPAPRSNGVASCGTLGRHYHLEVDSAAEVSG